MTVLCLPYSLDSFIFWLCPSFGELCCKWIKSEGLRFVVETRRIPGRMLRAYDRANLVLVRAEDIQIHIRAVGFPPPIFRTHTMSAGGFLPPICLDVGPPIFWGNRGNHPPQTRRFFFFEGSIFTDIFFVIFEVLAKGVFCRFGGCWNGTWFVPRIARPSRTSVGRVGRVLWTPPQCVLRTTLLSKVNFEL